MTIPSLGGAPRAEAARDLAGPPLRSGQPHFATNRAEVVGRSPSATIRGALACHRDSVAREPQLAVSLEIRFDVVVAATTSDVRSRTPDAVPGRLSDARCPRDNSGRMTTTLGAHVGFLAAACRVGDNSAVAGADLAVPASG